MLADINDTNNAEEMIRLWKEISPENNFSKKNPIGDLDTNTLELIFGGRNDAPTEWFCHETIMPICMSLHCEWTTD